MRGDSILVNLMAASSLRTRGSGELHPVHIRLFDPQCQQDRNTIMQLIRELQSHELVLFDRMKPPDQIEDETYLKHLCDECEAKDGHILVAETLVSGEPKLPENPEPFEAATETTIVGYAVVLTRVSNSDRIEEVLYTYGELLELAVNSEYRGLGIGKLLLSECEQRVRNAGVRYFRTSVLASNPHAHKLYERFGFSDHLVEMEKKLND